MDGLVDLMELAGEVAGGGGDGGDAKGGSVPDDSVVEFGDGEVEAVAEFIFHGTENLAAVFEGLRVRDVDFDGEFGDGHFSADKHKVDCHADADGGEEEPEDESVARDAAGLPGAGAELVNQLDVTQSGAEGDDDAEGDERNSGPEGEAGGANVGWCMRLGRRDLAEEETETADRETDAHESEAGADPGEEGPLGCEIDSGILLGGLVGGVHGGIVRQGLPFEFANDPGGHAALALDYCCFDGVDQFGVESRRKMHEQCFVDTIELATAGGEVAAAFEALVRHADGGGEAAEEEAAGFEDAPETFEDRVELCVTAAEVEDGAAVDEVEEGVGEGDGLEWFDAEVVGGKRGRKGGGEGAGLFDSCRVLIDCEDVVAFAEKIDEVAAGAAAGVEDAHARDDVAAEKMIEEIDVDEAELFLQIGHSD